MIKTLLRGMINKVKAIISKYARKEKIIAVSLLSRMLTLVLVSTFVPVQNIYADQQLHNPETFESDIKLVKDKSYPLAIETNIPKIIPGESNYNKNQREQAERLKSRSVVSRENRVIEKIDKPLSEKRDLAKRAAQAYGIDWKILEAVWQVETGKQWYTSVKSYAGAQGPMQFMRGTWNKYAVDGNGDGNADIYDAQDAVYAGANLLAQAGAASGNVDQALLSYNHAQWYVNKVKGVANSIVE